MSLKAALKSKLKFARLPRNAKTVVRQDRLGLRDQTASNHDIETAVLSWLYRAQDMSLTNDGGVASHYCLIKGWASSYPETTGYIVPSLLDWHKRHNDAEAESRAKRMLDWFVEIQFPEGGFMGSNIDAPQKVPVTFNTGQILIGLAAGVAHFGDSYREAMQGAANWLRDTQDDDGAWRKHATPFAAPGEKAYETHVAWGLIEADKIDPDQGYGEAARRNILWAITKQTENGWFDDCCLTQPAAPLTHTIGYVQRGIIEGYQHFQDDKMLEAATLLADNLLPIISRDGYLAGRLDRNWCGTVDWACVTGSAQIAHNFLLLHNATGNQTYREAGHTLNKYVKRTITLDDPDPNVIGGVKGSFPVNGDYGAYRYLNWAAKFTLDSLLAEDDLAHQSGENNQ